MVDKWTEYRLPLFPLVKYVPVEVTTTVLEHEYCIVEQTQQGGVVVSGLMALTASLCSDTVE